ncbi:MAG: GNAT family N-acetyltransferase [[Eubacterium] siraeum]|nr:GNAT family N-acetyltransferase [[Eubacterium] siraeum]
MAEIFSITQGHHYWNEAISLAAKCSWKAGSYLAEKMKNNEFAEWERVFVACDNGRLIGFCTLTEKDELPPKYKFTPFIGFVFVEERYRGKRLSEKIIECAASYARKIGYEKIYIMSGEVGLYEKYGFTKIGDFETVYGTCEALFVRDSCYKKYKN